MATFRYQRTSWESVPPDRAPFNRPTVQVVVAALFGTCLGLFAANFEAFPAMTGPALLIVLLGLVVVIIFGNVRRLLLAALILDIPLGIDINLDWQSHPVNVGTLRGFNVSVTTLSLIALYTLWLVAALIHVGPRPRLSLRSAFPMILYLGVVGAATFTAQSPLYAYFVLFLLLQMFLMYVYLVSNIRTDEDILFIMKALIVAFIIEALIMCAVFVTGNHLHLPGLSTSQEVTTAGGGPTRIAGTFDSFNGAGEFFSFFLPVLLTLLFVPVSRNLRRGAVLAIACGLVALVLTLSRGAFIAFGISMLILFVVASRRRMPPLFSRILKVGVALSPLLVLAVFNLRPPSNDAGAGSSRVPLMKLAWLMIHANPIHGVGPNNFGVVIPQYAGPDFYKDWLFVVHNSYMLIWAELGPAGLIAFLCLLAVAIYNGWKGWKANDPIRSPLSLGLMAGLIGQTSNMFVEPFHYRQELQPIWLVAALLAVLGTTTKSGAHGELASRPVRFSAAISMPEFRIPALPSVSLPRSVRGLIGNALSLLASDVTNRATTFVLYALVAHRLGAFAFGEMSLALTLFYTFQVLAAAGLKTLVSRAIAKNPDESGRYLANGSLVAAAAALTSIAACAVFVRLMGYQSSAILVVDIISLALLPFALSSVAEGVLVGRERMRYVAYANVPANLVKVVLAFTLLAAGYQLDALMALVVACFFLTLAIEWWFLWRRLNLLQISIRFSEIVSLARGTSTFLGIDGILAIIGSLNVVLLARFSGETDAGYFSASTQAMIPVMLIYQNVVTSVFPSMCRRYDGLFNALRKVSERLIGLLIVVALPVAAGLFLVAAPVIHLVYGPTMSGAVSPLQIIIWTLVLTAVTHVLGQTLIACGRERLNLRIVLVDAVATVVFGLALIPPFGVVGAAVAMGAVKVVDFTLHYVPVARLFEGLSIARRNWPAALATLCMVAVMLAVRNEGLAMTVIVGALSYGVSFGALLLITVGGPRGARMRLASLKSGSD